MVYLTRKYQNKEEDRQILFPNQDYDLFGLTDFIGSVSWLNRVLSLVRKEREKNNKILYIKASRLGLRGRISQEINLFKVHCAKNKSTKTKEK